MDFGNLSPGVILVTVVGLALAPFVAVMVTSFTKIVVVLSLLRNALGLQQVPPNVVVNGIAIILSIYVMYPVLQESYGTIEQHSASTPQKMDARQLIDLVSTGKEPLRAFLVKHSSDGERTFFLHTARQLLPKDPSQIGPDDYMVVVPAFTVTELTAAFQVGFLIFLPFLVIDLIVATITMAMGMMMLPPTVVSLPFKILFFVLIDGWNLLVGSLVRSFN